jgi:serine/threonine-protein kinase RsbT
MGWKTVRDEIRVPITSDLDIVTARQTGRTLASDIGMSSAEATLLATAISEVARNIVEYADKGEVIIASVNIDGREAVRVIARDSGPGIEDVAALNSEDGSSERVGMGLPGARRLMDKFTIESEVGKGTTVTMIKWKTDAGH